MPAGAYMLAPALIAGLLGANTLVNGFTYDDQWTLAKAREWPADWSTVPYSGRSLTYAVHKLNSWLGGTSAAAFHAVNLALHMAACALVAAAALAVSRSRLTAVLSGCLFAVHPVHTEVVASVSYRKDSLAFLFVMASLIAWLRLAPELKRLTIAALFLVLGLYAKEVAAIGLLPMLLVADVVLRRGAPSFVWRVGGVLLMGTTALWLMLHGAPGLYFSPSWVHMITEGTLESYPEVLATSSASLLDVFRLLFFPARLTFDYPTVAHTSFGGAPIAGLIVLVLWVVVPLGLRKRSPVTTFGMLWTVSLYLPSSNLVPLTKFFVAERYLYGASFGVCLVLAHILGRALASTSVTGRRAGVLLTLALLGAGGARSVARHRDWAGSESLASSAIAAGFDTWRARLMRAESKVVSNAWAASLADYEVALQLVPAERPYVHYDMATALVMLGRHEEAAEQIQTAKNLGHGFDTSRVSRRVISIYRLGLALLSQNEPGAAAVQLREGLRLNPEDPGPLLALALLLACVDDLALRDGEHALTLARAATVATRGSALSHFALAAAHAELGDFERARKKAQQAVFLGRALDPMVLAQLQASIVRTVEREQPIVLAPRQIGMLIALVGRASR